MQRLCIADLSEQNFWRVPPALIDAISARVGATVQIEVVRQRQEFIAAAKSAHYLMGLPFSPMLVRGNTNLRWVHFWTAQVPDGWQKLTPAICVTDSRGLNAASVTDHVTYLVYRALRGEPCQPRPGWNPDAFRIAQSPSRLTVGVMGYGEIGQRVVTRLRDSFGLINVLNRTERDLPAGCRWFSPAQCSEFVANSDYLIMTLPLSKDTHALFDANFYQALKPDVTIINVARGELVDESQLLAFLGKHPDARYLTDVTAPEPYPDNGPLHGHPQIFITPHVGGRQENIWNLLGERTLQLIGENMA